MSLQMNNKIKGGIIGAALLAAFPFIATHEGKLNMSYIDIAGVATQCYGETQNVKLNTAVSDEECDKLLTANIKRSAYFILRNLDEQPPAKTLVAFISLSYNIGLNGFYNSTARREWNNGNYYKSCEAIKLFNKVCKTENGRRKCEVVRGLTVRRENEFKLCLEGIKENGNI